MSDGEVLPRQSAAALVRGAANRAAAGSAGEEDEEIYDDDDDESSDYNSYDEEDESDESGWYYEDHEEEEEEQEGAGGDRASGGAEEEPASAGVGGCAEAEGSPRAAASCCICMDPWASYGAHRICCIPCGHVYGRSCLERWLRRGGNTSAKCPQCSERFKHRHIINLYSSVHLWNDCCLKEIRAESMISTSSVHPRPHAISVRISQLEARMEEERRLREEAVRRQEERIAAQNQFFEERMAAQNQLFEERLAAQSQALEERMSQAIKENSAALSQAFEERISQGIKERLEAERALYQEQFQEDKLKRPLSDMESWKMAREQSDRKAGESEYYGNTEEHLQSYTQHFERLHLPGSDVLGAAQSQIDDTAVVAIQGKPHGRYPCFDGLITLSVSYTWLRATNLSPLESAGRSQPPLARQHAAYKAFVEHRYLEVREYLQRVKANDDYNRQMMMAMLASWSNHTDPPQMGPPPPPAGEPPHVPTFDEWVTLGSDSPGTDGSTPASSTRVTPIWQSGAGLGGGGFDGGGLGGGGFNGGGLGGDGLA